MLLLRPTDSACDWLSPVVHYRLHGQGASLGLGCVCVVSRVTRVEGHGATHMGEVGCSRVQGWTSGVRRVVGSRGLVW
jgi:hypothetical protein